MLCAPSVRMFFESEIAPLEPQASSYLETRLRIPRDSEHHYFTLLFKIKTPSRSYQGPNLIAFIKVIDPEKQKQDEDQQ